VLKCKRCLELENEVADLKRRNTELAGALRGQVSRLHSNTDLILGAALSGGDHMALAKELAENERKRS